MGTAFEANKHIEANKQIEANMHIESNKHIEANKHLEANKHIESIKHETHARPHRRELLWIHDKKWINRPFKKWT